MIEIIKGGKFTDSRGSIRFVNDFDMTKVQRFYLINNSNLKIIRGWRGHRIEQRWFYAIAGSFNVNLVKIDNWEKPSPELPIEAHVLSADKNIVLHVPPGYATAFKSLTEDSELLVFADYGIDHAGIDDFIWEYDYFIAASY